MTHESPQLIPSPALPATARVRNDLNTASCASTSHRLVGVRAVAQELGISESTVYRLVDRRELAVHHVGRTLRFTRADLASYLAKRRVSPDS